MPVDYIGFAYAATVAAGGIIGYAKAGKTCVHLSCFYILLLYPVELWQTEQSLNNNMSF